MSESPRRPDLLQEPDRVSSGWSYFVIGLTVVLTAAALWWAAALARPHPQVAGPTTTATEEIRDSRAAGRLNTTLIRVDSTAQVQREVRRRGLEAFAWVDQEAGVVRIPVELAMKIVADRTRVDAP